MRTINSLGDFNSLKMKDVISIDGKEYVLFGKHDTYWDLLLPGTDKITQKDWRDWVGHSKVKLVGTYDKELPSKPQLYREWAWRSFKEYLSE